MKDVFVVVQFYPCFEFFFCFNLITIHYHTQKQRNMRFKPRIKFNKNISTVNEKSWEKKKKIKLLI